MSRSDVDLVLKVLLIGDYGVGKSAIVARYINNDYCSKYVATIGADFAIKTVHVLDRTCKLQIWDTAGQERFRTITGAYYRGARGLVLVYDVGDRRSFEGLKHWLLEARENIETSQLDVVVAASKCDHSQPVVSAQEGDDFARANGCLFFEVSAKTGSNVEAMFTCLSELMVKRAVGPQESQRRPGGVRLPTAEEIPRRSARSGCC